MDKTLRKAAIKDIVLILLALVCIVRSLPETLSVKAQVTAGSNTYHTLVLTLDSACPTGLTELDSPSGDMLLLTTSANGDVNTTGGSPSITPTGSVDAPVFTGSSGTVPAETFTGSSDTTSAVSAGTPAGTNGTTTTGATSAGTPAGTNSTVAWTIATGGYAASTTHYSPDSFGGSALASGTTSITVPAETFTGTAMATHTHTVPAEAFTGSALATHTHTLTPTGTNSTASFTPAGTNSAPAFAGNSFDPHPPYIKVLACEVE